MMSKRCAQSLPVRWMNPLAGHRASLDTDDGHRDVIAEVSADSR